MHGWVGCGGMGCLVSLTGLLVQGMRVCGAGSVVPAFKSFESNGVQAGAKTGQALTV